MNATVATPTKIIAWLDVPVTDMDRAIQFYREVLGVSVQDQTFENQRRGILGYDSEEVGCLVLDGGSPGAQGPLLYFSVDNRLNDAAAKVEANGGKVLEAKRAIGPWGFRALVEDSEGNRIALHSETDS